MRLIFAAGAATLPFTPSAVAAQESATPAEPAVAATANSDAVEQAAPSVTPPTTPGMTGPLLVNPKPLNVDAGPLGNIYITGVVSGIGLAQTHEVLGDKDTRLDLSNGQVFIQKTDGVFQFFVQAGGYSLPSLGTAYVKAEDIVGPTYGLVPQAFIKIVPSDHFNFMIGKLPTLQGAEYTFTFENMNVNRGLLWNQENAVNRGVQANFTQGKFSASLSLNDGYYSGKYNWLSGLVSYAVTPHDTVTLVASGNIGETRHTDFATPLLQNNGQVYDLTYTHNRGPLTITPYLQYTHVPKNSDLGIARSASTIGAAVLAKYSFTPEFSLAGRAEYIDSKGGKNSSRPSLIYGPGSSAWSLTLTPTYQKGIFFARTDLAYVKASNATDGFVFGKDFDQTSQARAILELGVLF